MITDEATNFQLLRIDQVSFDWAIAALTWLDKINKTKRVEKTLRIWDAFKRHVEIYENKYRFKLDRFIHIDEKIRIFDEAMVFANSY